MSASTAQRPQAPGTDAERPGRRGAALARFCGLAAHGARQPGVPDPLRLYQSVRAAYGRAFDEDFVALVVSFPEQPPSP